MRRLVYVSYCPRPVSMEDRLDILRTARERNQQLDITGVLFQRDSLFLQLLEGPDEAVGALYARILADRRHSAATVLIDLSTGQQTRLVPDWRMGFFHLSSTEGAIGDALLRNNDDAFMDHLLAAPASDPIAALLLHFWQANQSSLRPRARSASAPAE